MEEIRGKTLKEWKDYCKNDNVPINTMKYITCLEERIEALTIPVVGSSYFSFYFVYSYKQDGLNYYLNLF